MVAKFDTFEINPIHGGDAWKLCNFMVANEDRFKHYFPGTLAQNLNPTLSQLFVKTKLKSFVLAIEKGIYLQFTCMKTIMI